MSVAAAPAANSPAPVPASDPAPSPSFCQYREQAFQEHSTHYAKINARCRQIVIQATSWNTEVNQLLSKENRTEPSTLKLKFWNKIDSYVPLRPERTDLCDQIKKIIAIYDNVIGTYLPNGAIPILDSATLQIMQMMKIITIPDVQKTYNQHFVNADSDLELLKKQREEFITLEKNVVAAIREVKLALEPLAKKLSSSFLPSLGFINDKLGRAPYVDAAIAEREKAKTALVVDG